MYKESFFDLDGTLTESGEGITKICTVCTGETWCFSAGSGAAESFCGTATSGSVYEICGI